MRHPAFALSPRTGILATVAAILIPIAALAAPQCGTFEIMPTPNPGTSSNSLSSIAAVGDGTAWALGSQSGDGTSALLMHYDGSQWSEVAMPSEVDGVAFGPSGNTPDGDVWMIGTRSYTVYQVEVFCVRARDGVIDRVDSFPNGGAPVHISATAADDVWSVSGGIWSTDMGGYVQHFDGTGWTTMQLPAPFIYRNDPQAIYAAGPDDVWIAGLGGDGRARYEGYVQHWDGSTWERIPTPFDGQNLIFFESIDGSGPNDIWISGHVNYSEDLLLHWDGSSWTTHTGLATPEPLSDVVAPGVGNVWASPYSLDPGSPFYYFDGSAWAEGAELAVPGAVTVNWRDLSRGGACDVWAVGSYHDGTTHHTLAARLVDGEPGSSTGVDDGAPRAVALLGGRPNPFNPSTSISFALPARQAVDLRIVTARGHLVRTLLSEVRDSGRHDVVWDGRDDAGRPAGSGVYVAVIEAGGERDLLKLALVK